MWRRRHMEYLRRHHEYFRSAEFGWRNGRTTGTMEHVEFGLQRVVEHMERRLQGIVIAKCRVKRLQIYISIVARQ